MISDYLSTVDWSRAQFALTAIYHWLFVPLTLGLGFLVAIMETLYVRTGRRLLAAHHQILDAPVRHQLRHRRGDGHHPRIRVRHQLVELLLFRGRHLRRPAGHRGHPGLLPREHVRGRHVLRLEQGIEGISPHGHMAHGLRGQPLGMVDPCGQRLDAASRGLHVQPRDRAQRDELVRRGGPLARGREQVPAHGDLVVRAGRTLRRGGQRLVPAPRAREAHGLEEHRRGRGIRVRIRPRNGLHGRPLGRRHCTHAAHEARRHGGPL